MGDQSLRFKSANYKHFFRRGFCSYPRFVDSNLSAIGQHIGFRPHGSKSSSDVNPSAKSPEFIVTPSFQCTSVGRTLNPSPHDGKSVRRGDPAPTPALVGIAIAIAIVVVAKRRPDNCGLGNNASHVPLIMVNSLNSNKES